MKIYLRIIYLSLILIFFGNTNLSAQTDDDIRFLIDSISSLPDDTNKVIDYNDLLWQVSSFDSVFSAEIAQKSINLSKKLGYYKGLATAQKNWGKYYYYTADYKTAKTLYEQSLNNFDTADYKKGIAIAYRNLGNIFNQIGNSDQALNNYLKSLALREEIKDTVGVATMYSSIGVLYSSLNNFENYEDSIYSYFSKALNTFILLDNQKKIASTYLNFGYLFSQLYDKKNIPKYLDSAVIYSKKSLEISIPNNYKRYIALSYEILGKSFDNTQDMRDSALYYYKKSLEIRQQIGNPFGVANSLLKIGKYYAFSNDWINAEKYLDEALEIAKEINAGLVEGDVLEQLQIVYAHTNRYEKAYYTYNEFIQIRDSLENQKKLQQITQLSMQYEFDKQQKMQEIEQQKKDELQAAQIKRQKIITYFFIFGFVIMILFALLIFRSYKQKQKNNEILKAKNDEIIEKNALLNQSNEEIEAQKEEIEKQKEFLEIKNKSIKASINYALRIQQAVITPEKYFQYNFSEYLIFYKPRDIVSGDFYWASELPDGRLVVTVADCTGHGVPGAFMSMLGISFLNQIVNLNYADNYAKISAGKILDKLRDMIVLALGHGQEDDEKQPQEGMDMTLAIIDKKNKTINYAGAYNPLLLIRNDEITIHKVDKMPVGFHFLKINTKFTSLTIEYKTDDKIYMYSDGFVDQFGGENGRKYTPKYFREFLLKINKLPLKNQFEEFNKEFNNWIYTPEKDFKQIDDILIMGLKL